MVLRLCKNLLSYYFVVLDVCTQYPYHLFLQCVQVIDVHPDLRHLAYRLVKVRSYGHYNVNGFQFRSTTFEALRPLAVTTNSGVVMRAIDFEGRETNYYGIIKKIHEFSSAGNKELKVAFFDCDWFDSNNRTR
jgi:hypothetical protein